MIADTREKKSTPSVDRTRLRAVIEPVVSAHGAELCDFELKNENGWVLRVYVERRGAMVDKLSTKDAAVDLELCSNIARDLSPALDVSDPIPHRYSLEVGSPGVERTLRRPEEFVRFAGEKAMLKLGPGATGAEGQKVLVGRLGALIGQTLTLDIDSDVSGSGDSAKATGSYSVQLEDVVSARLVFEFGPAPKPVSSAKKKRRS